MKNKSSSKAEKIKNAVLKRLKRSQNHKNLWRVSNDHL